MLIVINPKKVLVLYGFSKELFVSVKIRQILSLDDRNYSNHTMPK